MRIRAVRTFLWSAFFLLASALLVLDIWVLSQTKDDSLWIPVVTGSLLILTAEIAISYFFLRSYSRELSQISSFAEKLLEPGVSKLALPEADDELGAIAHSLRKTAPRIRELLENLKLEGARREAVLDSMVEGVLAVDRDLRVLFCNNSLARILNARTPVSPGIPILELVRDHALLEIMKQVLAGGKRVEQRLTLLSAEAHTFEVLAGPLAGPSTSGAMAILHDVTELERLERVRTDFVANVSHELRTPLAAIRGYAETLLDGALEDRENNRKFVEVIMAQATRLTNIASDLLSLSELESIGVSDDPRSVSVRSAVGAAMRTVESSARLRGVRLRCEEVEDLRVKGTDLRLEQVLVNLLDNAVKFSRANGEVRLEAKQVNGSVCIAISDEGVGIPSEDLPRIFERFYRVDKARSREMGGTGLGLSIVKHAVEQMGGTVSVESGLGEGSKFTVSIPIA